MKRSGGDLISSTSADRINFSSVVLAVLGLSLLLSGNTM